MPMAFMTSLHLRVDMIVARDGCVGSIFLSASIPSCTSFQSEDESGGNEARTRLANFRSRVMRPGRLRAVLPYAT